jgi:hypothetical protein
MLDAEELFRVVAEHVLDETAEVETRAVRRHSGRHADDGQAGDENPRDN